VATLLGRTKSKNHRTLDEFGKTLGNFPETIKTQLNYVSQFDRALTRTPQCIQIPFAHGNADTCQVIMIHSKDFSRSDAAAQRHRDSSLRRCVGA
jgi:hypothetical protein